MAIGCNFRSVRCPVRDWMHRALLCVPVCLTVSLSVCLSVCVSSLVESPLNRWCVDVCANVCMPLKMRKRQCSFRLSAFCCDGRALERWALTRLCNVQFSFSFFVFSVFWFFVRVLIAQFAYLWWSVVVTECEKNHKNLFSAFFCRALAFLDVLHCFPYKSSTLWYSVSGYFGQRQRHIASSAHFNWSKFWFAHSMFLSFVRPKCVWMFVKWNILEFTVCSFFVLFRFSIIY